jgi:ribonucleoside-diphosphate reductase alpha chain
MDYLFRYLGSKFVRDEEAAAAAMTSEFDASGDLKRIAEVVQTASATPTAETVTSSLPAVVVVDVTNGHSSNGNGHTNGNGHAKAAAPSFANFSFIARSDAPTCAECGSIMVPNGSCHKCINCGTTSGCS